MATSKPKRGGARPGAGRKRKADTHAGAVAAAEVRCRDRLPATLSNLEALADGKAVRVETRRQLAGLVLVKAVVRDGEGNPVLDARGKPVLADQLAFPHLPADQLVVIEVKEVIIGPDRDANKYLADRVLGRPTEKTEVDVTSNGETVQTVFYIPSNGRDDDASGDDDAARDPSATGPTN